MYCKFNRWFRILILINTPPPEIATALISQRRHTSRYATSCHTNLREQHICATSGPNGFSCPTKLWYPFHYLIFHSDGRDNGQSEGSPKCQMAPEVISKGQCHRWPYSKFIRAKTTTSRNKSNFVPSNDQQRNNSYSRSLNFPRLFIAGEGGSEECARDHTLSAIKSWESCGASSLHRFETTRTNDPGPHST
jgi:hypothetical protein